MKTTYKAGLYDLFREDGTILRVRLNVTEVKIIFKIYGKLGFSGVAKVDEYL